MVKRGKSDERTVLDVDEIATLLKIRKQNGHATVLVLGSRAGAFFQSEQFYQTFQQWSARDFRHLTQRERFQECYTVLTTMADRYGELDTYHMLRTFIDKSGPTRADICLADLIQQGYFEEIISTNIDDSLEQALINAEMRTGRDFEIYDSKNDERTALFCRIIKVFGDLRDRDYAIGERLAFLDSDKNRKALIERLLKKETLMIGFDALWDQAMLHVIAAEGETLWFVNEEDLGNNPLLVDLLQVRKAKSILVEGGYEQFITKLYRHLTGIPVPVNYLLGSSILDQLQQLQRGQKRLQEENANILNEIKQLRQQIDRSFPQSED